MNKAYRDRRLRENMETAIDMSNMDVSLQSYYESLIRVHPTIDDMDLKLYKVWVDFLNDFAGIVLTPEEAQIYAFARGRVIEFRRRFFLIDEHFKE